MKKIFWFLPILSLALLGSICYAGIEEYEHRNIVNLLKGETRGERDINYDGKVETILIEKNVKIPGVITKLVILSKKDKPLFYLSNLNKTNVYGGLKDLKRAEEEINELYHKVFYEKRKNRLWHPLIPDERIHIERPKKSGIKGLDDFEERLAEIWIKSKKLNKAGALSFGKKFYGFKIYAFPSRPEINSDIYLLVMPVNSKGKGITDFKYIWDSKTKSYMDIHKYLSREHPDYPF